MALSAKEIDERRFAIVRRGYDIAEVDDLLDRLAAKVHRIERELNVLRTSYQQADEREGLLRSSIEQLTDELAAARDETAEAQRHTEQTRQMFDKDLRDRAVTIRDLQQQLADCQGQLAAGDDEKNAQIDAAQQRLQAANRAADEAQQQLVELSRLHDEDRRKLREELEALRRQLGSARNQALHLAEQQAPLEEASQTLRVQVAELTALITGLRDEADGRRSSAADQLQQIDAGLEALQRRVEGSAPPGDDQRSAASED